MVRRGADEEDDGDLPWLAPARTERVTHVRGSRLRVWLAGFAALLLLVVGLIYALVAKPEDDGLVYAENGEIPLIRAPEGPFKTRPDFAGGMDVEGLDQTTYEAAGGVDPGGELALDALPEEPMARPVARPAVPDDIQRRMVDEGDDPEFEPAVPEPPEPPTPSVMVEKQPKLTVKKVDPPATPAEKAEPKINSVGTGGGGTSLQLGAFSSAAKANEAWKSFTSRYTYLDGLEKAVDKIEREDEKPLYRLRATGAASHAQAANLCARLRVAGEACVVR